MNLMRSFQLFSKTASVQTPCSMEDLAALQANQKNQNVQDWEEDATDPLEKLMVMKDSHFSTHDFGDRSGSFWPGQEEQHSNFSWKRWNNDKNNWTKETSENSPSSYYSCQSSASSGSDSLHRSSFRPEGQCTSFSSSKILQRSSFHAPMAHLSERGKNSMNYYESEMENNEDLSSWDGFSSVSRQAMSVSPCQLARSLVEFPDYQATLLTLLDECQYDHKKLRQVVTRHPETFEMDGEMVRLRPKMSVCRRHLEASGCPVPQTCQDLHICLQYLTGRCGDENCQYGHIFHTDHNKPIYHTLHLNTTPVRFLFGLFKSFVVSSGDTAEELEVCESYNDGSCYNEHCQKLHLCLKLLANRCSSDGNCKLNHNVLEKHSSTILELQGLSLNESPRDILTQISSLPLIKREIEVVKSISSELVTDKKEQSQSKEATNGGKVALDTNDDASGAMIKTNTNSDKNKVSVVASSGGKEKPISVKTIWSHDSSGEVTLDEICYNSVEGFCPYEETGCWRLHCDFHFHWQVRSTFRDKERFWVNLTREQALALEKAFCDPSISKISLPTLDGDTGKMPPAKDLRVALSGRSTWKADFHAMQLIPDKENKNAPLELRRLCTEYSPNNPIPEPCVFKWYFLDKNRRWIEYGKEDSTGKKKLKCNITSDYIEKVLRQNGSSSLLKFKNLCFAYLLDLKNMTQTNLKTNVTRKVRRRPQPHLTKKTSPQKKSHGVGKQDSREMEIVHLPHSSYDALKP